MCDQPRSTYHVSGVVSLNLVILNREQVSCSIVRATNQSPCLRCPFRLSSIAVMKYDVERGAVPDGSTTRAQFHDVLLAVAIEQIVRVKYLEPSGALRTTVVLDIRPFMIEAHHARALHEG